MSELNVTWKCMKNDIDKQKLLLNFLPREYIYEIKSYDVIRDNEIRLESKFTVRLSTNVCSEEAKRMNLICKIFPSTERQTNTNYVVCQEEVTLLCTRTFYRLQFAVRHAERG